MRGEDHSLPSKALPPFAVLRAFEAVFRVGGIRKAAAALDLSHAVVSRHVRVLEDWLGQALVIRAGNRLTLTEPGKQFHARISAALIEISEAVSDIRGLDQSRRIRVSCGSGLSFLWLSDQIADFEREFSGYSIELRPTDEPANLLAHEADVDIRFGLDGELPSPVAKGLKSFEFARPEVVAVASPAEAERLNAMMSIDGLLNEVLLHEDDDKEWRLWLSAMGVDVPAELPGTLCYDVHVALATARRGRGIAITTLFLAGADLLRGDLVEVRPPGSHRIVLGGYRFTARENRWSSPPLPAFRRFLRHQADTMLAAFDTPVQPS